MSNSLAGNRTTRRGRLYILFVLTLAATLVSSLGTTAPANAVAGSAVATLGYNSNISQYQYSCAFAGWGRGPTKKWSCNLETVDGIVYAEHKGTFSGSGFSTSTYSFKRTNTTMCVVARASYSGGSDEDRRCN